MSFQKDLKDVHLLYDYDVTLESGEHQKWRYEIWFSHESGLCHPWRPYGRKVQLPESDLPVYSSGRTLAMQLVRGNGTIVSLVYDILNKRITILIAFSKGHWEHPLEAHGNKRNAGDFARWRKLAREGIQTDRHLLSEQADILEIYKGPGQLEPIDESWDTI